MHPFSSLISQLFEREKSVIGKHIRNIFKENELTENTVRANFAYSGPDGKEYDYECFNKLGTDISPCDCMPGFSIDNVLDILGMKI